MATIDERIAGQKAKVAQLTAGITPSTSAEGAEINRVAAAPSRNPIDFGSPEVNQQAQDHNARIEAEAQAKRDAQTFPDASSARRAAQILQEHAGDWDEARLTQGWNRVKRYVAANPEAAAQFAQESAITKWRDENMDTTPHQSSRLAAAQSDAQFQNVVGFIPDSTRVPKTLDDLRPVPADSREQVVRNLELEGVDTTSGIGGFWTNVGLAVKLNDSAAQAKAITGIALDNLEEAGIVLPEGVRPITVNQDIGMLEVLMPTPDGKVKRTLVEPENMNLGSAGRLADLEELMAGVYAATAVIRGGTGAKHPFVRELVGDLAGRNVGIMLESIISGAQGEADLEDIANAFRFKGNITESGLNTAVSRGLARGGRILSGAKKKFGERYQSG